MQHRYTGSVSNSGW